MKLTICCSVSDSKGEAAAIETELLKDYRFGQQQLVEIWGQACAVAIAKVCTPSAASSLPSLACGVFTSISSLFLRFPVPVRQSRAHGEVFCSQP